MSVMPMVKTSSSSAKPAVVSVFDAFKGRSSSVLPPIAMPGIASDDEHSNVLVMLLPASAVRWGKSWEDSREHDMDWMFKSLNYTASSSSSAENFEDNATGSRTGAGTGDMWLEIGCSVFRAHLVKNVTFSA